MRAACYLLVHLRLSGTFDAALDHTHRFDVGRSPRISRNSVGPFVSLRFRRARSSAGIDGSPRRSSSWPAIACALDADFLLRLLGNLPPASACSSKRRIAPERDAAPSRLAQTSRVSINACGRRTPTSGSAPVAGRLFFFRFTDRVLAIRLHITEKRGVGKRGRVLASVARMSEAKSGASLAAYSPHVASLMRATCY